ncbi:MAG TPA: beta-eliminating lyase-related protein, partial [Chitinophagaceae bacterium]|nr:beta-eliminating lyase-related protein [Chitinophagaceae bacterium]
MRSFKSDNFSGVHPEIFDLLQEFNADHAPSYGNDIVTEQAERLFENVFKKPCKVAHVFNGTGANILCLRTALRPYQSVLCSEWSHIATNETGAAESIIGSKILTVPGRNGKIYPAEIEKRFKQESLNEIHATQPKVLSIAQCTEYGTVYTAEELHHLRALCNDLKLYFHMDGCRLYNAAVSLGASLAEISSDAGVDMLSLGGTKNGAMMA